MPDDQFWRPKVICHMTELAEWTPELAEQIAGIKVDDTPVATFWSIPKEHAHKYPFKRSETTEENENA